MLTIARSLSPVFVIGLSVLAMPVFAQTHDHHSKYADEASSGIAGLTAREVEQLENGEGMGLARPAELNRYPGPKHVIDAAKELELSEEQLSAARAIFDGMQSEAIELGREIIAKERALARRFEHRHIDEEILAELTREIGVLQGRLRAAHLRAHLEMTEVLTPAQIDRYQKIRGYTMPE